MSNVPNKQPVFSWCQDSALEKDIVALFTENVDSRYISHSELQYGRADTTNTWSATLADTIREDVANALNPSAGTAHLKLAIATVDELLAAIAFVSIDTLHTSLSPFATLDDMVVSPSSRGYGLGKQMLDWLSSELHLQGIKRLFLESGIENHHAHRFFHKQGFNDTSIVMMKELD